MGDCKCDDDQHAIRQRKLPAGELITLYLISSIAWSVREKMKMHNIMTSHNIAPMEMHNPNAQT